MTDRIAYVDCFSGASGDMLLGALVDAGLDVQKLKADLGELDVMGYELQVTRQMRHGISGTKLDVVIHEDERPARRLSDVQRLLEESALPPEVVEPSLTIFGRLAEVESAIHGTTIEEVHFHEVGAVDSLVDVVGFCSGVRHLGIERLYASPLPLGHGTVRTEHGLLPVPAPATLALLARAGAPTLPSQAEGEMVTPTGAAILTTLATFSRPAMTVRSVGYGFGTKEFPWPNMLRLWVGDALAGDEQAASHDHQHHGDHRHEPASSDDHGHHHH